MGEKLFSHPSLKGDYFVPDDLTPEEEQDALEGYQRHERQTGINAKQARESKRQFNAQLDQAGQSSQPLSALSEGALNTVSLGTSDAGAALAGSDLNAPTSARNTNPYAFATGQTLGALVPGPGAIRGAKTIGNLALRSAGLGGLLGATSGASNQIVEGERDPGKIVEGSLVPGALGAAIGGSVPLVGAGLAKYGPQVLKAGKDFLKGGPKVAQGAAQNAQVVGNTAGNVTINQGVQQAGNKAMSSVDARKVIEQQFADFNAFGEIQSAIKPTGAKKYNFQKNLTANMPEIAEHFKPGSGMEGFESAVDKAMVNNWAKVESALEQAGEKRLTINGDRIAEKISEAASNAKLLRETGGTSKVIDDILAKANTYRGEIPVSEAEAILRQTNAELDAYYNTLSQSRFKAQKMAKANPEKYADILLAEGIRKELDEVLTGLTGERFGQFKRQYGQLQEIAQSIQDAKPRIMSHQELSLQQKIGLGYSIAKGVENGGLTGGGVQAAKYFGNKMIAEADAPDAKINRAFDKIFKKTKATKTNFQKSP